MGSRGWELKINVQHVLIHTCNQEVTGSGSITHCHGSECNLNAIINMILKEPYIKGHSQMYTVDAALWFIMFCDLKCITCQCKYYEKYTAI